MNAVIYARYSPGPNQTDQSIEGQVRECKQYAKDNNITIVGSYIDRAQTGRNDNRAAFQKMLKDSEKKLFEAVIVWKINRFGRNREEIAFNKVKLRKNGVQLLYAKEHIPDGPEGIILESMLEGLAEYYSENLRQDVIRGMRESALKCKFNGAGKALGYIIDKDKNFVIDSSGAAIVRKIFNMYDSGKSQAEIIRYLNDNGYKTGSNKPFTYNAVYRMLTNRKYIGEYSWSDVTIADGVPRIIDDDIFERVQIRIQKNKKAPARKVSAPMDFLLTTKLFCGKCGEPMSGDSGTSRNGSTHYYYTCHGKKARTGCKKKSVRKEFIEDYVINQTVACVLQDDVINQIADRVIEIQTKDHNDKSQLKYYESRLKKVTNSIDNIVRAIEQGIFNDDTKTRLDQLSAEKEDLMANIAKEKIARPDVTKEQVVFFLSQFKKGDRNDPEFRRRIVDTFINKIFLYDDKITITYNSINAPSAEISLEQIEEAAYNAGYSCSDSLCPAPPIQYNPNTVFFINSTVFAILKRLDV